MATDRPTATQWIEGFCRELGLEAPDQATVDLLLRVAAEAAHSSERIAAPIACYLIGRAGVDPERALEIARSIR